ncbi:MAG TPA: IPT/TIG domain-containing protein [Candidatus Acidoferrum sp.]|nr:IPT/TIG domain-containing protein [Candidatus Acidoferrum sp.]
MKRFWTAMAVAVCTIFFVAGCNDYGNTFQSPGGASLIFLSPSQVAATTCVPASGQACPSFTLALNGGGFVPQTRARWNGKTCPLSTSPGASTAACMTNITLDTNNNVTALTATITAALYSKPGTAIITTINPNSNYGTGTNGLSNPLTFIINNPANPIPTVTSVSPACVNVGSSPALTITGTNFLSAVNTTDPSQNNFSTMNLTVGSTMFQFTPIGSTNATTITSTQITVTVPAADLGSVPGTASVTVYNPPSLQVPNVSGSSGSGGGTSTPAVQVTIQAAGTTCATAAKASANSVSQAAVSEETPAVSLDGRYVAYTAVSGDHAQVFLRDTCEGAATGCQPHTSMLSVTSDGDAGVGDSHTPSMSSDGRYVAFSSNATDLVENAPAGRQIYLRDTCINAADSCKPSTILISTDSNGALGGTESILPSISSSGRYVAFLAITPSRTAQQPSAEKGSSRGAANSGLRQVFVRDTCLGFRPPAFVRGDVVHLFSPDGVQVSGSTSCTPKTTRISVQPGDGFGVDANPAGPALSGKATHVAATGAKSSTLLMRSVPVDDSVFLAITSGQR